MGENAPFFGKYDFATPLVWNGKEYVRGFDAAHDDDKRKQVRQSVIDFREDRDTERRDFRLLKNNSNGPQKMDDRLETMLMESTDSYDKILQRFSSTCDDRRSETRLNSDNSLRTSKSQVAKSAAEEAHELNVDRQAAERTSTLRKSVEPEHAAPKFAFSYSEILNELDSRTDRDTCRSPAVAKSSVSATKVRFDDQVVSKKTDSRSSLQAKEAASERSQKVAAVKSVNEPVFTQSKFVKRSELSAMDDASSRSSDTRGGTSRYTSKFEVIRKSLLADNSALESARLFAELNDKNMCRECLGKCSTDDIWCANCGTLLKRVDDPKPSSAELSSRSSSSVDSASNTSGSSSTRSAVQQLESESESNIAAWKVADELNSARSVAIESDDIYAVRLKAINDQFLRNWRTELQSARSSRTETPRSSQIRQQTTVSVVKADADSDSDSVNSEQSTPRVVLESRVTPVPKLDLDSVRAEPSLLSSSRTSTLRSSGDDSATPKANSAPQVVAKLVQPFVQVPSVEEGQESARSLSVADTVRSQTVESSRSVCTFRCVLETPRWPFVLPNELWLFIFSHLSASDLAHVARSCSFFHQLASDSSLWRSITVKNVTVSDETLFAIGNRRPRRLNFMQCRGDRISTTALHILFDRCGSNMEGFSCNASRDGNLDGHTLSTNLAASECKKLAHLDFSWSNVEDASFLQLVHKSPKLLTTCLSGCKNLTARSLCELFRKHGPSLLRLELNGCFQLNAEVIAEMARQCNSLSSLSLSQCYKLTDSHMIRIAENAPGLRSLDLRGCKLLKDVAVEKIARTCMHLESIALANCPNVTSVSLVQLAGLHATLKHVDVSGCKGVKNDGLTSLATACVHLRYLDISSTSIDSRGLSTLAHVAKSLRCLKLNFLPNVGEPSLLKLLTMCKTLEELHIYGLKGIRNIDSVRSVNRRVRVEFETKQTD